MSKIFLYLFFICCTVGIYSCQKEMSVELGSTLKATGSLWDTSGNCLPDSVHGTFYNGITAGSDTAYVDIQVNVTATGSYKIESSLQDGFLFSDSGFFTNTGLNTVRLKPLGTPIITGDFDFNISFDSSFCTFSVTVNDSTGTGLGGVKDTTGTDTTTSGNWQFSTDSAYFHGIFDSVFTADTLGYKYVYMIGKTAGTDSLFYFSISFPNGVITPGTYEIQAPSPSFNGFELNDPFDVDIYTDITDPTSPLNGGQITVDFYNTTTHVISGTFSGTASDNLDNPISIGNGSFTATVP